MHSCYICRAEEPDMEEIATCHTHFVHWDCLAMWYNNSSRASFDRCMICNVLFPVETRLKLIYKLDRLDLSTLKMIGEDDIREFRQFFTDAVPSPVVTDIIICAIENDSKKLLEYIEKTEMFVNETKYTEELVTWLTRKPTLKKIEWILGGSQNTPGHFLGHLMKEKMYLPLFLIFNTNFNHFTREQHLTIAKYLFHAAIFDNFHPNPDKPKEGLVLMMFAFLSRRHWDQYHYITGDLLFQCISHDMSGFIYGFNMQPRTNYLLLVNLLTLCARCKKHHYWRALEYSIQNENREFFQFLYDNLDRIPGYLERNTNATYPHDELKRLVKKSKNRDLFGTLFQKIDIKLQTKPSWTEKIRRAFRINTTT